MIEKQEAAMRNQQMMIENQQAINEEQKKMIEKLMAK